MAHYKLTYFNGKGLAEFARYVLAAADQDYDDNRFSFEDWPTIKPNTPFGQVPLLEVTEGSHVEQIAQSNTIARFLANRFGLAGKNDVQKAKADMFVDQLSDLSGAYRIAFYLEPDPELKKEKVAKFYSETVPQHLELLEKLITKNNTKFVAGDEMTYADLGLSVTLDRFRDNISAHIEKFPNVKRIDDFVNAHPKIAAWRAKRPVTPF